MSLSYMDFVILLQHAKRKVV